MPLTSVRVRLFLQFSLNRILCIRTIGELLYTHQSHFFFHLAPVLFLDPDCISKTGLILNAMWPSIIAYTVSMVCSWDITTAALECDRCHWMWWYHDLIVIPLCFPIKRTAPSNFRWVKLPDWRTPIRPGLAEPLTPAHAVPQARTQPGLFSQWQQGDGDDIEMACLEACGLH